MRDELGTPSKQECGIVNFNKSTEPIIKIGLFNFSAIFFLYDLNNISEKILFGSPCTINIGLFITNKYIFFYFVKVN